MNFQTPVIFPKADFTITHRSTVLLFGSCFSENIGLKLEENKFNVVINPFGILYNPYSISCAIDRLLSNRGFTQDDFIYCNEAYHSFMHHGVFSNPNLDDALSLVNRKFDLATTQLKKADFLLITFGTSYVFRWKETGEIVGNCHKIPASQFTRERLTIEEITLTWKELIDRLLTINPNLKILFTVSPIRHFKDGAHENQLSKAILLLSIEKLVKHFVSNVFYFPAYEVMMDELRDYRFYADDMLHPSQLAQNYIWKKFGETYFSQETREIITEWKRIHQSILHRPNAPASKAYQRFVLRTIEDIKVFESKYPFISCKSEKEYLLQIIQDY